VIDSGVVVAGGREKKLYEEFMEIVKEKNIRYLKVGRGDLIKGFPGTEIIVLNPPRGRSYGDLNNDSVVVQVIMEKGSSILFCADVESKAIKDMLCFGSLLRSDVLKVPHHGAGLGEGAVIREFVNCVRCSEAVITNNISPAEVNPDLSKEFKKLRTSVHITGRSGAVIAEETNCGVKIRGFCSNKARSFSNPFEGK